MGTEEPTGPTGIAVMGYTRMDGMVTARSRQSGGTFKFRVPANSNIHLADHVDLNGSTATESMAGGPVAARRFQRNAPDATAMATAARTASRRLDGAHRAGTAAGGSGSAVPERATAVEDSGISVSSAVASSRVDAKRCSGSFSRHRPMTR